MKSEYNSLPTVGTPEEAKERMKQGYASFLDSCAKFLTLANYYSEKKNEGKALPATFMELYQKNHKLLKESSVEDFGYYLAQHAALYLDYIEEIKENLTAYQEILKGQDPSLSDYDKACDLLAIKDEFTDLEKELNQVNRAVAEERYLDTHINDKDYDPQVQENTL